MPGKSRSTTSSAPGRGAIAGRCADVAQYTEQIQAFVDPETRDRIHRLADGRGPYRASEIIREALASGLPIVESVEALRRESGE